MKGFLTMKQDLWLVNSSLALMFAVSLGFYALLLQKPPRWVGPKALPVHAESEQAQVPPQPTPSWEKIYLDDIFSTYVPKEVVATKQNFVTPIPEPKAPTIVPPPDIKKIDFVAPLTVTLHGIIVGSDESKNAAMIADETNKEGMYRLGEKIKDAQIIKIANNRVVFLRANGQQEIFYLRKDEALVDVDPVEKWKTIVRKVDDQNYEVDPTNLSKEVATLGDFIERTSIIGTTYQGGKPIGIRIGTISPRNDVATALGLLENDIITTINDLDIADQKNRISAYDTIATLALDQIAKIGLKRAGNDVVLSYKMVKIEQPRKRTLFPGINVSDQPTQSQPPPADLLKPNRLQQREQDFREFNKLHPNDQRHQQSMMEIRRRILENLQQRAQNTRNH